MDLRPVIHLWLNKPEVYGGCGYCVAEMKNSVFHGDIAGTSNGKSKKVWGNDYNMLDVWIDIDMQINRMPELEQKMLHDYIRCQTNSYGAAWKCWQQPPFRVQNYLTVIVNDILKEGKG